MNADDFGLNAGVNQGIIEAHRVGVVTSTSLMVRAPNAAEAVARSRAFPALSLGLHVDLGEWAFQDDSWIPLYEVVPLDHPTVVAGEVNGQVQLFRELVGRNPTHLDSHQHVHQREPVRSTMIELARQLGIPLRHETPAVRYCGDFYGQTTEGESIPDAISAEAFMRIIAKLPPGISEMCCHPGFAETEGDPDYPTMYNRERHTELEVLCHPDVKAAIAAEDIELRSFADLSSGRGGAWWASAGST